VIFHSYVNVYQRVDLHFKIAKKNEGVGALLEDAEFSASIHHGFIDSNGSLLHWFIQSLDTYNIYIYIYIIIYIHIYIHTSYQYVHK